jgi:hypothetical protein
MNYVLNTQGVALLKRFLKFKELTDEFYAKDLEDEQFTSDGTMADKLDIITGEDGKDWATEPVDLDLLADEALDMDDFMELSLYLRKVKS